jgi:hypothetical protein
MMLFGGWLSGQPLLLTTSDSVSADAPTTCTSSGRVDAFALDD